NMETDETNNPVSILPQNFKPPACIVPDRLRNPTPLESLPNTTTWHKLIPMSNPVPISIERPNVLSKIVKARSPPPLKSRDQSKQRKCSHDDNSRTDHRSILLRPDEPKTQRRRDESSDERNEHRYGERRVTFDDCYDKYDDRREKSPERRDAYDHQRRDDSRRRSRYNDAYDDRHDAYEDHQRRDEAPSRQPPPQMSTNNENRCNRLCFVCA
ncbi:hypothetical protein U1Q18_052044, partial [Sarracenia purpurea var. burkii]